MQHCENVVDHVKAENREELGAIEEEIGRITSELSELAKFSRLNYTGFVKILKKHDKRTDYMLRPMFMLRLKSKSLYAENSDSLIYRLSKLYDRIRSDDPSRTSPRVLSPERVSEGQVFMRKTSKYWVHSDNVTEVKCFVLKYLPVLIFPSKKRKVDLAVSSVYLDNAEMELYKGRLEKTEGAIAIRIRWYGSDEPQEVFIERKVHREDWTGEISVKARFPLKAKHIDEFLAGSYGPHDIVQKMNKRGALTKDEQEEIRQLASEIQTTIREKGLRPRVRTFYNRTAFQLPGDARVRISLDTELCMIREDGPKRSGGGWKREDLETNYFPFDLAAGEVTVFPHAILEVKLQTHAGQEPPKWANALISSHLVEEVPKFSKFIHGCATLFSETVPLEPYWLSQMATDIRRPPPRELEDEPEDVGLAGSSEEASSAGKEPLYPKKTAVAGEPHITIQVGGEGEGEGEGEREGEGEGRDESARLLGPPRTGASGSGGILGHFASKDRGQPASPDGARKAQGSDKRIHVPVRVEPKVFFANERTFLSWIHFSIFLGGIATALVGLGNHTARISGYLFGAVSVLFTAYALYLYQWRADRIRQRDPGPYDDRIGPVVIVIVFMVAMLVNMVFAAISDER